MRRIPWSVLFGLLLGVGMGLAYTWVFNPHPNTAAQPGALRPDFKDQYRSLIAASYAATGDLPRAQARLSVMGDADPIEALNAQAQRMRADAQTFERADQVAQPPDLGTVVLQTDIQRLRHDRPSPPHTSKGQSRANAPSPLDVVQQGNNCPARKKSSAWETSNPPSPPASAPAG